MGLFNLDSARISQYTSALDQLIVNLQTYGQSIPDDIKMLQNIRTTFDKKLSEFNRDDRKLRIAVIGQVKAGKSSFLNTLLFDGEQVLPKAATPKTATLTIIEHAENNILEVDFYTAEEWSDLEAKAREEVETEEVKVAREIMAMVRERGLNAREFVGNKDVRHEFENYDKLVDTMNNYTGENGTYTPLVKSLKMYTNNERLKDIQVVDTPGLNDPVLSRTDVTRQYIEYCDVVFFLSPTSNFLDKSDMELLTRQLPQKGIKKMVLIASKYDSGLMDTMWNKGGFQPADVDTKARLKKKAEKDFDNYLKKMIESGHSGLGEVIESCKNPLFVSSMMENMSKKKPDVYNKEELNIYEEFVRQKVKSPEEFKRIGNFDKVREIFQTIVSEKEKTLLSKAQGFVPTSAAEVRGSIQQISDKVGKRLQSLEKNDIQQLEQQKKHASRQKNNIALSCETIFSELLIKLERNKNELLNDLRRSVNEYSSLSDRRGSETITESYKVSTSKWYNPFSWGSYERKYNTYTETYTYLDVSDAVENLRRYANEAASNIGDAFNKIIDFGATKRQLLKVISEHFDTSDESFDVGQFKLLVEQTLNQFEIPVVKIDVSKQMGALSSGFSGEVRSSSEKSSLRMRLVETLSRVFEIIENSVLKDIEKFKTNINEVKDSIADRLLENINKELDEIIKQFENRLQEIENNKQIIAGLSNAERQIKDFL
jgi:tRNA U34 5-carboxymethylaminomethyl modifying GTPase MnmE/TrmE